MGLITEKATKRWAAFNPAYNARTYDGTTYISENGGARCDDGVGLKFNLPLEPSIWAGSVVKVEAIVSTLTNSSGNVAYRMWVGYSTTAVDGTALYRVEGVTLLPDSNIHTFADSTTAYYATKVATSNVTIPSNVTQVSAYFELRRGDAADTSTTRAQCYEIRAIEQ